MSFLNCIYLHEKHNIDPGPGRCSVVVKTPSLPPSTQLINEKSTSAIQSEKKVSVESQREGESLMINMLKFID